MKPTLRTRIRDVVDDADRRLAQPEIYARLARGAVGKDVFVATITQMVDDRQLDRRKATKAIHAETGARFVYGPGRVPVEDRESRARYRANACVGFMELKRRRETRARVRREKICVE